MQIICISRKFLQKSLRQGCAFFRGSCLSLCVSGSRIRGYLRNGLFLRILRRGRLLFFSNRIHHLFRERLPALDLLPGSIRSLRRIRALRYILPCLPFSFGDSRSFLLSALTEGEISMIDYLVEIDLYYDALEQALAAERDYRHALAALTVFSL